MADTLTPEDVLALRRIGTDTYESAVPLVDMGPMRGEMAYGGSAMALAVMAGYHSLPAEAAHLRLHSVMGHFLAPNRITAPLHIRVTRLRDTRSFATRQVVVSQPSRKTNELQACCVLLVDFIAKRGSGDATLVSFSEQPPSHLTHHSALPDHDAFIQQEIKRGYASQQLMPVFSPFFHLLTLWHSRWCPEGVLGQTAIGMRSDIATPSTSDDVAMSQRRSWDWITLRRRCKTQSPSSDLLLPPNHVAASAALLVHYLDTFTSVLLPWFARIDNDRIDIFATLDFAVRFHVDDIDASQWHLRQQSVAAAHDERDFVEERLWRECSGGKEAYQLVATMSQQCVLRGKADADAAAAKL